ncbi:hypothetical protein BTH41_04948 [Bacillus mycoides]|nr:hypothetical protein BTH41_04948 [Bacillus mycoides]
MWIGRSSIISKSRDWKGNRSKINSEMSKTEPTPTITLYKGKYPIL